MYGWDILNYYKAVTKRNWIFSFLKGPLTRKMKTKNGLLKNSKGGIIGR